jgi:transposase
MTSLRRTREALTDLQGQLDNLLGWLADPSASLDRAAPDRLAGRAREASEALASLGELRRLLPGL